VRRGQRLSDVCGCHWHVAVRRSQRGDGEARRKK
jgi:hypothetical protein